MSRIKIGISIGNHYGVPTEEVVDLIAAAGFDAVSPQWERGLDLTELVAHIRAHGLLVESLHAPYSGSAAMWSECAEERKDALQELLLVVDDCANWKIPVLVCHTWIGFAYTQTPTQAGLNAFGAVVARATERGVKIAFENTEGEEFLFALMQYFRGNPSVGFCWDSGHEMCYNHSEDILGACGDNLLITHLNDNLGISRPDGTTYWTDDLHLMPFDGIADWSEVARRLRRQPRLACLNFEINRKSKPDRHENDAYMEMPLALYYAEVYKRACRVAALYQDSNT